MQEDNRIADIILGGFDRYRREFLAITQGARERFVSRLWVDVAAAARRRILLYKVIKTEVCAQLSSTSPDWEGVRQRYADRVAGRADAELAGTFFNSIYRHSPGSGLLDDRYAFVLTDPPLVEKPVAELLWQASGNDLSGLIREMLQANELADSFADLEGDVQAVVTRLRSDVPPLRHSEAITLEVVNANFYRNKGAYIIGSLTVDGHIFPLAIGLVSGIRIDAVVWGEDRLSTIFSFTRSYFMVDAPWPNVLVSYLQSLLPFKRNWELYTSLGFFKHGKTAFVRGYRLHLERSDDTFYISEGIKGQIMMVFGLKSYQIVFKIMKDRFPATKTVTHDDVRACYQLVKTHDRVGRMADTQEFHNFSFPRSRFQPELLDELLRVAADCVEVVGDDVFVTQLYAERMMTPLNIYVKQCSEFALEQVLNDYGNAIRELAAANIFPGDMLLKNFGVTRHGRVVFYDYDEICYLTDVNFRDMPVGGGDVMAAEPWFEVGEYDVFPEEFSRFLFPDETMKALFSANHGDLFTAAGWQTIQDQVQQNLLTDVFPYPQRDRLP